MEADYETGRANLERLVLWYSENAGQRNEATTRLHLIDRLFFDCLGWARDDTISEESHGGKYADYTFLAPRRILIVEAKKEGFYFEVPVGKKGLEYGIPSLLRDSTELDSAMKQAARYCQDRGVPYGAVTNGHQIVAFIASRSDGRPPLEGKALVFPDLEHMLDKFIQLWRALSRPGIENKELETWLAGKALPRLPSKLSAALPKYPGVQIRNVFQAELQTLSEIVIEDITRAGELESQFLAECYSPSGALSQYSVISKNILSARYSALFDSSTAGPVPVPAVEKKGVSSQLLAESLSRRPILLVGDVGVGKTMFIRHLTKIDAAPLFDKAIALYIDLGSQANLAEDLRTFIVDEMSRQLRDQYGINIEKDDFVRAVYRQELKDFEESVVGKLRDTNPGLYQEREIAFLEEKVRNKDQHLKHSIQHASRAHHKQIVIFVDNADQRPDATQQEAFLISQELAQHWEVTVFVALRPETYYRSMRAGALSGYHPKAFTIYPPRIDRVLEKRLKFALKLTRGEVPLSSLGGGTEVSLGNLETIILAFLHTLRLNERLVELIDNIAAGNVRLALDLVKSFFGSGHVNTAKIVATFESKKDYIIPLHEFQRAVIYGDARYYDPVKSPIANLFDVARSDAKEHFLLPIAIGLLTSLSNNNSNEGFIDTPRVYEQLQGYGFTPDQIDLALVRGHRKKLIETAPRQIPEPNQSMPLALRATSVGVYHVSRLCQDFPYIDAVAIDTPIFDPSTRELVHDVENIADRLNRADIFRRYLDKQWAPLEDLNVEFDWPSTSGALKKHISQIRRRISAQS